MPSDLQPGTEWICNPNARIEAQVRVKFTEHLSSFTNSAGRTFQDVIKLTIAIYDSSGETESNNNYYSSYYEKISGHIDIFFAKGAGIAGLKLNHYEHTRKVIYRSGEFTYDNYYKKKMIGEAGVTE